MLSNVRRNLYILMLILYCLHTSSKLSLNNLPKLSSSGDSDGLVTPSTAGVTGNDDEDEIDGFVFPPPSPSTKKRVTWEEDEDEDITPPSGKRKKISRYVSTIDIDIPAKPAAANVASTSVSNEETESIDEKLKKNDDKVKKGVQAKTIIIIVSSVLGSLCVLLGLISIMLYVKYLNVKSKSAPKK
eukprot:GAHX01000997.1.p1 GENE.GAHX01000997.1~~GAHX01000997.1.p1  ORF type:complete len:186 (-),score=27.96 GAHX01000997.1:33-590(-)